MDSTRVRFRDSSTASARPEHERWWGKWECFQWQQRWSIYGSGFPTQLVNQSSVLLSFFITFVLIISWLRDWMIAFGVARWRIGALLTWHWIILITGLLSEPTRSMRAFKGRINMTTIHYRFNVFMDKQWISPEQYIQSLFEVLWKLTDLDLFLVVTAPAETMLGPMNPTRWKRRTEMPHSKLAHGLELESRDS